MGLVLLLSSAKASDALPTMISEPVRACIIPRDAPLTNAQRQHIAACLGWVSDKRLARCNGYYQPIVTTTLATPEEVQINADSISFYNQGRSVLKGHVDLTQTGRIVSSETAYVHRDAKSGEIKNIELLGGVRVVEPGRIMFARKAEIQPEDKSGTIEDVLYRFNLRPADSILPAWGQASLIQRFPNEDYLLRRATYTTCAPEDRAWHIEAETITLDNAKSTGTARHAKLFVGRAPIFYAPYLSFPTSRARKSGFLYPTIGSSNVGGVDFSLPYYWNMAPNYDATITPHLYSKRGFMMGGEFRFLTDSSLGQANARFLSHDRAYENFLEQNSLDGSSDRWAVQLLDDSAWNENWRFRLNFQQVSDDYFLQDFNSNFAILTERQLPREGMLSYTNAHWLLQAMVQSYQTLQPINQTPVLDIYQRLPQLLAVGHYDELPFNSHITMISQLDNFRWPNSQIGVPQGPRYYMNPILSIEETRPWGYLKPSVEVVQNAYDVNYQNHWDPYSNYSNSNPSDYFNYKANDAHFQRTIPRYGVDGGLFFDRRLNIMHSPFVQTLEPRVYYLNVPFHSQAQIPVYDSAYMIFNVDQLFRNNRFSGFDRIGDTNQLSYALTSRWVSELDGLEKASFSIGQIQYFTQRRVGLCQSITGQCSDNPYFLGFLSNTAKSSPIASRAVYHFNPVLEILGDYVWDPARDNTYNSHVDFTYQTAPNRLARLGYTYLTSGDITQVGHTNPDVDPLHQASFAYAWPFNDKWSSLGAISYNISKNYEMMSFFGVQYDSCCWAVRLIGGRSFMSLSSDAQPQYNNNIYLQVQLKGLGALGNSDPTSIIRTFLPGYYDSFHQ